MTDIKVAASLTASLLAPKGEARPAGWRAVAARTTEQRPWYAALAHDRAHDRAHERSVSEAQPEAEPAQAEADAEPRPRAESLRLRAVPLAAPEPADEGLGAPAGTTIEGAAAGPPARAEPTSDGAAPAGTMSATGPAASLARLGGRRPDAAGADLPTAAGDAPADRVRITARLDRDLHRRLKLASAHLGASSQDLIADALSHYLDGVAAGPMRGHCACLTAGAAGDCGGCGDGDSRA